MLYLHVVYLLKLGVQHHVFSPTELSNVPKLPWHSCSNGQNSQESASGKQRRVVGKYGAVQHNPGLHQGETRIRPVTTDDALGRHRSACRESCRRLSGDEEAGPRQIARDSGHSTRAGMGHWSRQVQWPVGKLGR